MTDTVTDLAADLEKPDELTVLKTRARVMGIAFSNNISVETLRAKIQAKMDATPETQSAAAAELSAPAQANPLLDGEDAASEPAPTKPLTKGQIRQKLMREAMKLVRVRITNLNPAKKDLPGEIFCIANRYIGTVKKFIPYGEVTDNGYHIPYCIYQELEARRFNNIRVTRRKGREHVETSWAKEFALEVLPQLTPEELRRLALQQAAAKGTAE
jgi:hypothetical protein